MRTLFFFVAAVAIVGIAWNVSRDSAPDSEISTNLLFPELLESVNDVNRMSIVSATTNVELARSNSGWVVSNRDDFPADISKVRSTLLALSQTTALENKTSKPERYGKIGVNMPDSADSDSRLINVFTADETKLAALIIGNKRSASQPGEAQYFVRQTDSETALLVQGNLELNADPIQWMDTDIVDIPAERVRSVTIGQNEATPIVVSKQNARENFYSLANIPAGFTETSRSVVSSFGALLLGVRFDNVFSADKFDGKPVRSTSVLETFDGLRATIEQYDHEDSVVTRVRFAYDPELVEPIEPLPEEDPESENKASESTTEPSVENAVDDLNEKVAKWLYVLPDYKNRLLAKKFDEMIKEQEPPLSDGDSEPSGE
jgi:hypothetical protein